MDYIKTSEDLLRRKDLNPIQKFIISLITSYQSNGKYCFLTMEQMGDVLGTPTTTVRNGIRDLIKRGIVFKAPKREYAKGRQYKNRKVIVFVDKYNPLPTDDTDIHPTMEEVIAPTKITTRRIFMGETIDDYQERIDKQERIKRELRTDKAPPITDYLKQLMNDE